MGICAQLAVALVLCSFATLVPARAGDAMVDEVVGKYFLFAGLNTRIDGIETVAKADANPILANIGTWGAIPDSQSKGYLLVHFTSQNPSSSDDRGAGTGNCKYNIGFEFQDGTQRDMDLPARVVAGKSYVEPPDNLHPKQTVHASAPKFVPLRSVIFPG